MFAEWYDDIDYLLSIKEEIEEFEIAKTIAFDNPLNNFNMKKNIAVIEGDGIGPEVTKQSIRVLNAVAEQFGHEFDYHVLPDGC